MEEKKEKLNVNLNPEKVPVLYIDSIFMHVSEEGVTLDMCQKIGHGQQIQVVSRVGLSKEHAMKFVKKFSEILALSQTKNKKGSNN